MEHKIVPLRDYILIYTYVLYNPIVVRFKSSTVESEIDFA